MKIAPCWSCGSDAECFSQCDCAKCINPEGYDEWKYNNPEEYQEWLNKESQRYEDGEY